MQLRAYVWRVFRPSVFDIRVLGRSHLTLSDDFSGPLTFFALFQELSSRNSHTIVKVNFC